jgi:hypothetical protein
MNKDPESWARVSVDAVCAGSSAQVRNVLAMALDDIRTLSMQMNSWRELALVRGRTLEQIAADLWRADNPDASVFDCDANTKEFYRARARRLEAGLKED